MRRSLDTVEEFWDLEQIQLAKKRAGDDSLTKFQIEFARFIGVPDHAIRFMPSGHHGLQWLLEAKLNQKGLVMVPAFNCSVVQDAIEAAGCQVQLYDFSANPGQFDWEHVIDQMNDQVGTLIVTHYFGVPIDFRPILDYCRTRGVVVIEDCAHTLGGTIGGRQAGTLGDAAIFSFNYDKPISLGWGGVAVVNNASVFDVMRPLNYRTPSFKEEGEMLDRFMVVMSSRRRMIPFQNSLTFRILRRMRLIKQHNFLNSQKLSMGSTQAELGRWSIEQYPKIHQQRNANAEYLAARVKQQTWHVGMDVHPAWLKQKVLIKDPLILRRLSLRLQRRGLRAGNFNWPELISDSAMGGCATSNQAATRWMDLPIHQYLDVTTLEILVESLNEAV